MTLNACVKTILCGLSQPVLNSINALISAQVTFLTAQLGVLQAQLLQYSIVNAPIRAAATIAQGVADTLKGQISIVPFTLFQGCADIGKLGLNLSLGIDAVAAEVDAFLRGLDRLLAVEDEINALIVDLQAVLAYYADVQLVISGCGN